jgi:hypothetical protein
MFDDQMVFGFAEEPIEEINQPSAPIDYPDPNVIRETDCKTIRMFKANLFYKNGELFWRTKRGKVNSGHKAGHLQNGYTRVTLKRRKFFSHTIIWRMFFGNYNQKTHKVDHKNGKDKGDAIENLRLATNSQNAQNRIRSKGIMHGICWHKEKRKWRAEIMGNGIKYDKCFYKKENAIAWRRMMEEKLHGEYLSR